MTIYYACFPGASTTAGTKGIVQTAAVASYRRALSLGGTRSIPQLFEAAGATLAFDSGTLRDAVELLEQTVDVLRPEAMAEQA